MRLNVFSTGYAGSLTRRATDFFGNPIANPQSDFVYTSDTQQGLGLAWQLRGPSIWNRVKRIRIDNGGRDLAEGLAAEALRVRLRRSYFDALEQEELLRAERAVVDATRCDLKAAQWLFELGLKTRVDVLQAGATGPAAGAGGSPAGWAVAQGAPRAAQGAGPERLASGAAGRGRHAAL